MAFKSPPEFLLRTAARMYCRSYTATRTSSVGHFSAAQCVELGKPLKIVSLPSKPLRRDEVRIKVEFASINFADVLICKGAYQEKPNLPFVPGGDFAGTITEVGSDITHLDVGARVCGLSPKMGCFSEEVVINHMNVLHLPDEVETRCGAGTLTVYGTASMGLKRRCELQEGQTVLVTGAAGGVGLAFVDLAANVHKANVIAACSTAEKCEIAKRVGAAHVINYSKENLRDRVMEITSRGGADVIVENVGGDIFNQCLRSIAFEGKLLVIGFASGTIPKVPANIALVKSCSVVGLYWGSYSKRNPAAFMESLADVMKYLTEKKIKPVIGSVFPLNNVNDALATLEERKSVGKVVLNM